ncbi:MAG: peptidase transporter [Bacteroidetes bacterium]|nr:peptidase transporter [Bacteroidota bacterium]
MDCGPTCLRMIASYYSKEYSLEYIRGSSNISQIGTSLRGLIKSAELIGLKTQCVNIPLDVLLHKVTLPCIIHWENNHYCVLYKIKRNKDRMYYYIADPRSGKVKYNEFELKKGWLKLSNGEQMCGIAILLEPTNLFYSNHTDQKDISFLSIFSYIKPYKKSIIQLCIGLIAGSFLQLLIPFLTQIIVDYGINGKNIKFIYIILIAQLAITVGNSSIDLIRGWILMHLGTRINISLISDFLSKLMKLPISFFDSRRTGDIIQRIIDHSRIENFLTNSSLNILFSCFSLLFFGIIIFLYNWQIFLIYLLGSSLYIIWVWLFMKRREEIDNKNFAQQSENQSNLIELVSAMQDIKLNSCEEQKKTKWESIQLKIYQIRIKSLGLSQIQDSGGTFVNQIKNMIITAIVASFVVKGELTLGMMISIQYILGQLNGPVDRIIGFFRQVQDAKLSYERLQEVQRIRNEVPENTLLISDINDKLDIHLSDLSFSYDIYAPKPTLENINISIPNGKQTAIVGMSGSGKTTLIKLLLGFYEPLKGEILLGDLNLSKFNIDQWRKRCGVVMQEGYIYNDTIIANIAPYEDTADINRINYSAEMANIKEFIEQLPMKFETKIGKEGIGLSQGQKQRILIARAIYKNPDYIFFDEATNALDANNEKDILEKLKIFFKGKTSIIVAHRLSTVRNADQIVVIDNGRIVEVGNHNMLISNKGMYYQLVKNQLNI